MSRIGNLPIPLPDNVEVSVADGDVLVKGPKGQLTQFLPEGMSINVEDGTATVIRADDTKPNRARHGLTRALIANMVHGTTEGYAKTLKMVGVGYRCAKKGSGIEMQVGFSHPVAFDAPDGITFDVPDQTTIVISGMDKQQVGQMAATIRDVRPPEPYKGKGIRYIDEVVRRKAGKAAAR